MLWSELFAKYSHLGDVKQCIPKLLPVFHKSLSKVCNYDTRYIQDPFISKFFELVYLMLYSKWQGIQFMTLLTALKQI